MHVAITKPLFAWDCLQDSPSLVTIRQFLASIPDAKLLEGLRLHRGRGRNDCPVHVAWGVVLLRIALRHGDFEATLAELGRNEALRRLIGIEKEEDVPKSWNISRFLDSLGREPHLSELRRIFDAMVERLGTVVPDLGKDTAGDSTALHARQKGEQAAKAEIAEGLPQPSGGKKEYPDDDGKVTKIVEWFGYKLHLLVDAKHEVVLAYRLALPARCGVQRRQVLRQDGACGSHDRPAAVPADPSGHEEVRAVVRRPHIGGAGERPVENLLGCR